MIEITINSKNKTAYVSKDSVFKRTMIYEIAKSWIYRKIIDCTGGNLYNGNRHYVLVISNNKKQSPVTNVKNQL